VNLTAKTLFFFLLVNGVCEYYNTSDDAQSFVYKINNKLAIKGLVHPKMKILSVFTHPHVVPNLCVFICSAEHKGRYLNKCFNQTDLIPH